MSKKHYSVCVVMAHVDNIAGCCTLAFAKEFLEEEPISNDQDSDDDDFLPLFLSECSDLTATKSCSLSSGIHRNSKLQCFRVFIFQRKKLKDFYFPFSVKAFFRQGRPLFLIVVIIIIVIIVSSLLLFQNTPE